jgi:hypothetical protein
MSLPSLLSLMSLKKCGSTDQTKIPLIYSSHLNFRFLFFDTIMKYAENSSMKRNLHIYKKSNFKV